MAKLIVRQAQASQVVIPYVEGKELAIPEPGAIRAVQHEDDTITLVWENGNETRIEGIPQDSSINVAGHDMPVQEFATSYAQGAVPSSPVLRSSGRHDHIWENSPFLGDEARVEALEGEVLPLPETGQIVPGAAELSMEYPVNDTIEQPFVTIHRVGEGEGYIGSPGGPLDIIFGSDQLWDEVLDDQGNMIQNVDMVISSDLHGAKNITLDQLVADFRLLVDKTNGTISPDMQAGNWTLMGQNNDPDSNVVYNDYKFEKEGEVIEVIVNSAIVQHM